MGVKGRKTGKEGVIGEGDRHEKREENIRVSRPQGESDEEGRFGLKVLRGVSGESEIAGDPRENDSELKEKL